jgi:hypothetical protein
VHVRSAAEGTCKHNQGPTGQVSSNVILCHFLVLLHVAVQCAQEVQQGI